MKKELIIALFNKFEQARYFHDDIECWRARVAGNLGVHPVEKFQERD